MEKSFNRPASGEDKEKPKEDEKEVRDSEGRLVYKKVEFSDLDDPEHDRYDGYNEGTRETKFSYDEQGKFIGASYSKNSNYNDGEDGYSYSEETGKINIAYSGGKVSVITHESYHSDWDDDSDEKNTTRGMRELRVVRDSEGKIESVWEYYPKRSKDEDSKSDGEEEKPKMLIDLKGKAEAEKEKVEKIISEGLAKFSQTGETHYFSHIAGRISGDVWDTEPSN